MIVVHENVQKRFYQLADEVLKSGFLSEGKMNAEFANQWQQITGLHATTVASGGFGLWALCEFAGVRDCDVVVPTNTFMATPLAVEKAGGRVVFADCDKSDLCLSRKTIEEVITPNTKAVIVVHVGGHIAFDIENIAALCKERNIALIEDCAHAHGATFKNRSAGSFGMGGAYSFYATKTLPTGEGGMVVSADPAVTQYTDTFKNYGKFEYQIPGFHGRLPELIAAFGIAQTEHLDEIISWKRKLAKRYDEIFEHRVALPKDMESGFYKYIVFDTDIKEKTGLVYGDLCHELRGQKGNFPNSQWIKKHHVCPPIWYGYDGAALDTAKLKSRLLG